MVAGTDPYRTVSLPASLLLVREETFTLTSRQTSSSSLLSRGVRVGGTRQQVWTCKFDIDVMERAQWQAWKAFIASLDGQAVLFEMTAPATRLPLGSGAGFSPDNSPYVVTGTTITGTSIVEGATTATVTRVAARYARIIHVQFPVALAGNTVLEDGDLFGLGGNLYMAQGKVRPDATGLAAIPFLWRLWRGASPGDVVSFRDATCRMQLSDAEIGKVIISPPNHGRSELTAEEVPYV